MENRYAAMKAREEADMLRADYMDGQPHIDAEMRKEVVQWMVASVRCFELLPEVLASAVRLFDMALAKWKTTRKIIQLIGIAGLALAQKFHDDDKDVLVEDWRWISDDIYTRKGIAGAQRKMAVLLDYNMATPTAFDFVHEIAMMADMPKVPDVALYRIELSMLDYAMLRFAPSLVAAASLRMSDETLDLEKHTGYSDDDLAPCISAISSLPLNEKVSSRHPTVVTI